jgi:hypothetical protein
MPEPRGAWRREALATNGDTWLVAVLPGAPASDRSAGFAKADNAQRPSGADRSPRLNRYTLPCT